MQLKSNVFWLVAFGLSGADIPSYPPPGTGWGKGTRSIVTPKLK